MILVSVPVPLVPIGTLLGLYWDFIGTLLGLCWKRVWGQGLLGLDNNDATACLHMFYSAVLLQKKVLQAMRAVIEVGGQGQIKGTRYSFFSDISEI